MPTHLLSDEHAGTAPPIRPLALSGGDALFDERWMDEEKVPNINAVDGMEYAGHDPAARMARRKGQVA